MSDSAPVLYDVTDGVGTITLNRPEAMNSLDIATKVLLRETVTAAAEDPAVRCVVLTGTGRAFCTGQDLKEHIQILESGSSEQLFTTVDEHYNPIVLGLADLPFPVVAAINGPCVGAGLGFAMTCDLRIAAAGLKFSRLPSARFLTSNVPAATPFGPITTCHGTPIRSAVANLAPARWSVSS